MSLVLLRLLLLIELLLLRLLLYSFHLCYLSSRQIFGRFSSFVRYLGITKTNMAPWQAQSKRVHFLTHGTILAGILLIVYYSM